ncbi:MAG: hypothetical protein LBB84_04515 [Tannerellaceae bacterium]|jgi:hypothetical protein|nr:hypothetical protein [Tannerellaceae bacterium]
MDKYVIIIGLFLLPGFMKSQALYNQGDIHIGGTANIASLYIEGNLTIVESGSITHTGKTILTGNFVNNITGGHVFAATRNGTFEFRGAQTQYIEGTADKAEHYIEFPQTVVINNQQSDYKQSTVRIDPNMGATMKNITFQHGRLVLDSQAHNTSARDSTDIAHLLAETGGNIIYKHNQTNLQDEGVVQVNLSLGTNYMSGRLVGFSPPFKKLYADYFLFNFLAIPDKYGMFNKQNNYWIKDPKTELSAGRGYMLGQGLVPWNNTWPENNYYLETLDPQYATADRHDAIRDTFVFARRFAPPSFTVFVKNALIDGYAGEELNTGDVTVPLTADDNQFIYLGNPYTVPLDLSELADASTLASTIWGSAAPTISKRYYILSGKSSGSYLPNKEFQFNVSPLVGQAVGNTAPLPHQIAPMQMFAVTRTGTSNSSDFIIPASRRTHGTKSFLRSAPVPQVIDELLIETKDGMTGGYDRLCIVFRNNATLASTDMFDAPKLFNRTGGVNQIYTLSSDKKELTTSIIPPSTKTITMYFEPARQAQEVVLKADRLSSITSVDNIVLEDVQTGKLLDLKKSPTYRFVSSSGDKIDRFVLHFDDGTVGLDAPSGSVFRANYEANAVWVYGIRENQIGTTAYIYDMLGNLLHQQTVTEVPSFRIGKSLSRGLYIIRLSGEASVARFAVK